MEIKEHYRLGYATTENSIQTNNPPTQENPEPITQLHPKVLCLQSLIRTHKRFKRTLFIWTKRNMRIFGVLPFLKLQNDTQTTVKR